MLLSFIITWILQLTLIHCLFSSFDSILRPKPVTCGNLICLQFTNHVVNKSGLIPIQQFGLQSAIGGEKIIFWLVNSVFLAYHGEIIYILGPIGNNPKDGPSTLTVTSKITPTIDPAHKLIILGNDTLITYYLIKQSLESSIPKGTKIDLIKLYKINVVNASLTHLDSISFNSSDLSALTRYVINSATTVEGFTYLSGIRTLNGWDETFTIRLCSKYTLKTFVEIYNPSMTFESKDFFFIHSLIYSIAIEPISTNAHARLLIAFKASKSLYIVSLNGTQFDIRHQQCLSGIGPSLVSQFSSSLDSCALPVDQIPLKYRQCEENSKSLPTGYDSFSGSWTIEEQPLSLTMVYIDFPVNSHIAIYVLPNGEISKCPLLTSASTKIEWNCDHLGNLPNLTSPPFYPPFLNASTQTIELYNPISQSIVSFQLMSCSLLTNCLACNLFGRHFNCKWNLVSGFGSSCVKNIINPNNMTVNVTFGAQNIDECFEIISLSPEVIILPDPLVQFKLYLSVPGKIHVGNQNYEFVIYVAGDPCYKTTHIFNGGIGNVFMLTCTLSNRNIGVWPVTWSVGVNKNQQYANRFMTSNLSINITIDAVPINQPQAIRQRQNYLAIFIAITITLIILFIFSLTYKRKPKYLYFEQSTSIPEQIRARIARKISFIKSRPSYIKSQETKISLLSNRL